MSARDFDLAARREKIMDTVAGLAYVGVLDTTKDHRVRAHFKTITEEAKEIGERFSHYALEVVPLAMAYDPNMNEVALRQWARTISEALKR